MSWKKRLLSFVVVVLIVIQFIPVDRENPPVTAELKASPELMAVFRRACYDCHSNETKWPWYSRIAPVSFLVARDVHEGREHLNFSRWGESPPDRQAKKTEEIWEEVSEGEMPLAIYKPLHPEAKLEQADLDLIRAWTGGKSGGHVDDEGEDEH